MPDLQPTQQNPQDDQGLDYQPRVPTSSEKVTEILPVAGTPEAAVEVAKPAEVPRPVVTPAQAGVATPPQAVNSIAPAQDADPERVVDLTTDKEKLHELETRDNLTAYADDEEQEFIEQVEAQHAD